MEIIAFHTAVVVVFSFFAFHAVTLEKKMEYFETKYRNMLLGDKSNSILEFELDKVKSNIDELRELILNITTETINSKLILVEEKISKIDQKLSDIENFINPDTAPVILNIHKMAEEIADRETFTNSINDRIKQIENRVDNWSDVTNNLQLWIWGSLLTVIIGIFGLGFYIIDIFRKQAKRSEGD